MSSFLALAVLAIGLAPGTPEPVQWETSYGKALEATRADQKPLLVVLDDPSADAARVSPAILSPAADAAKQLELLGAYERCHVDVTTEYGQKVAAAFKATTFPYVAVIDKTGSVILYQKAGQSSVSDWEQILAKYKSGDRSLATTRVTYKPVANGGTMFQTGNGSYIIGTPNCPTCQQRSF